MREPFIYVKSTGEEFPYSKCCAEWLRGVVLGQIAPHPEADHEFDFGFRRDYAARLLRERGL